MIEAPTRILQRAAEEIANRERCEDFETFKPLLERVKQELNTGARISGGL